MRDRGKGKSLQKRTEDGKEEKGSAPVIVQVKL